jgi:carbohydrate kinase (thermoresistant glucokinase family)
LTARRAAGLPEIITCSALKRAYRKVVVGDRPEVRLVYLRGSYGLIADRLARRSGHFMPPSLLRSQFDTLEEPGPEEDPLIVDIGPSAGQIAESIISDARLVRCAGDEGGRRPGLTEIASLPISEIE